MNITYYLFEKHLFHYLFLLHFDELLENVSLLMNSKELSQITSTGDQNKMRNMIILIWVLSWRVELKKNGITINGFSCIFHLVANIKGLLAVVLIMPISLKKTKLRFTSHRIKCTDCTLSSDKSIHSCNHNPDQYIEHYPHHRKLLCALPPVNSPTERQPLFSFP